MTPEQVKAAADRAETLSARSVGRPTTMTLQAQAEILERIADGESLRAICSDERMPGSATVFRFLGENEQFREQYAHAREAQADKLVDDMLEIADDARNDWMERRGEEDAGWQVNGEHIQRSRLRIDARKWMATKLAPKKYGDKLLNEHAGPDGGPIKTEVTTIERRIVRPDNPNG